MENKNKQADLVKLTIDDQEVEVPRGTNLIEAANKLQQEIPHYCYHKDLSVVGNCRMCQVEVEGAPKLMIGCHTQVQPDMKVRTHLTSEKVKKAQADTLELILINHPLDCTVCDQAGHCKLQDYHFEYNGEESRFLEEKEHKPKAVPLGPTIMLDAERCIMCTRCIRFCDEVTETSELGMVNRGDRSTISINPGKELNNPFSGNVADLCPVGALTHRKWRFNTRIWYTKKIKTICPGCSTGCGVEVATRDGQVVHVKGRASGEEQKEWICDEGRYGFDRFIPKQSIGSAYYNGLPVETSELLKQLSWIKDSDTVFFLSPCLLLEDFYILNKFKEQVNPEARYVVTHQERELSELEAKLISPDYSANYRSAVKLGLVPENPAADYDQAIRDLKNGSIQKAVFVGDRSLLAVEDVKIEYSLAIISDAESLPARQVSAILPARALFEKSGLMINRENQIQVSERLFEKSAAQYAHWQVINQLADAKLTRAGSDREITLEVLKDKNLFAEETTLRELRA